MEEQFNFPLADVQKNLVKKAGGKFSFQLNLLVVAVYLDTHTHTHACTLPLNLTPPLSMIRSFEKKIYYCGFYRGSR